MSRRQPTWLWWLAFLILFFGGLIAYLLSQVSTPTAREQMNLTLAVTVVAAGICIICATADWWIQR